MKNLSPFIQGFEKLPNTLAIFPLDNAVVMPGSHLPLNIFEPRYLNMIQDAIGSHRLIGMIQPRDNSSNSKLFDIGCAARITRYEECNDGRIELLLTGLCRFEIKDELTSTRGYRLIVPAWDKFNIDYESDEDNYQDNVSNENSHHSFLNSLKLYFDSTDFKLDWKAMEKLNPEDLFNSLYYFIELLSEDKQMLLEMNSTDQRMKALTALLTNNEGDNIIRH